SLRLSDRQDGRFRGILFDVTCEVRNRSFRRLTASHARISAPWCADFFQGIGLNPNEIWTTRYKFIGWEELQPRSSLRLHEKVIIPLWGIEQEEYLAIDLHITGEG